MNAAERIVSLYDENAQAFDAQRGRALAERGWLDRFRAPIAAGAEICDLGCGSGEPIAAALIAAGLRVTGVDSSPNLVALCRARFPRREWIVADMRGLDLGRRFAGLLAWNSFFHLTHDDQRAMFPVFARHADAGAPLMFTSGPAHGEAIGRWQGEPLYHASLAPEEYERLLADHGFRLVDRRFEDPECGGLSVWLAQKI